MIDDKHSFAAQIENNNSSGTANNEAAKNCGDFLTSISNQWLCYKWNTTSIPVSE